jgi:ABC-type transport system involved in multi-copper enzyme maturation permease subunit
MAIFRLNPVAIREMRSRMRGPRTFVLLGLYLTSLTAIIYIIYLRSGGGSSADYGSVSGGSYGPTISFQIGQNIFIGAFLFLLIIVALVTPVVTASAVSREVENRTYEMLAVTPVSGRMMVTGKLFSSLGFVLLLLLSALPLTCFIFIFGGVDVWDLLVGYAVVVVSALAFGAIGFFFSALLKRTAPAVVATYVLIVLLVVGSLLVSSTLTAVTNADESRPGANTNRIDPRIDPAFDPPKRLLAMNPIAAIGSIITPNAPFRPTNKADLQLFPSSQLFGGDPRTYYGSPSSQTPQSANALARKPVLGYELPLWVGYLLIAFSLFLAFVLLSIFTLRTKRSKAPKKPKPEGKSKKSKAKEPIVEVVEVVEAV